MGPTHVNSCSRPSRGASKEDLLELHREKMRLKRGRNERRYREALRYYDRNRTPSVANLSPFHPDYGKTHAEHAVSKAQRFAGRVPFVSKEDLRRRRGGLLGRMFG